MMHRYWIMCECLLSGATKAAVDLLSQIGVTVLESVIVDELCEFKGRENLADAGIDVKVTSLVRTESVDAIPRHHFFCC